MKSAINMGVIIALCFCLLLPACGRKRAGNVARILPQEYKIAVAPFTQPLNPSQLISGSLPEAQGRIPADALEALNYDLRRILTSKTNRQYDFMPVSHLPTNWSSVRSSSQPQALGHWVEYGRKHHAEWLLVPQILDWHEREGSEAGVTNSAHARLEFYLIDLKNGLVAKRSIFEEKQVGLVDNLLAVGDFMKRRGRWIEASQLAQDAMEKAVGDLGL